MRQLRKLTWEIVNGVKKSGIWPLQCYTRLWLHRYQVGLQSSSGMHVFG